LTRGGKHRVDGKDGPAPARSASVELGGGEVREHPGLLQPLGGKSETRNPKSEGNPKSEIRSAATGSVFGLMNPGDQQPLRIPARPPNRPISTAFPLPKPPQLRATFLQRGGVALDADGQLERGFVLRRQHRAQRRAVLGLQGLVFRDHGLQVAHDASSRQNVASTLPVRVRWRRNQRGPSNA
jgi:hypothetical protein